MFAAGSGEHARLPEGMTIIKNGSGTQRVLFVLEGNDGIPIAGYNNSIYRIRKAGEVLIKAWSSQVRIELLLQSEFGPNNDVLLLEDGRTVWRVTKEGEIKRLGSIDRIDSADFVVATFKDRNGEHWAITSSGMIWLVPIAADTIIKVTQAPLNLPKWNGTVASFLLSNSGVMHIALWDGGLVTVSKDSSRTVSHVEAAKLGISECAAIAQDPTGQVWVSDGNRIVQISSQGTEVHALGKPILEEPHSIVERGKSGTLIATNQELLLLESSREKLHSITAANAAPTAEELRLGPVTTSWGSDSGLAALLHDDGTLESVSPAGNRKIYGQAGRGIRGVRLKDTSILLFDRQKLIRVTVSDGFREVYWPTDSPDDELVDIFAKQSGGFYLTSLEGRILDYSPTKINVELPKTLSGNVIEIAIRQQTVLDDPEWKFWVSIEENSNIKRVITSSFRGQGKIGFFVPDDLHGEIKYRFFTTSPLGDVSTYPSATTNPKTATRSASMQKILANTAGIIFAVEVAFWLVLLSLYESKATVRAIFFWNPRVRKILSFGVFDLLVLASRKLQMRLLSPLRQALGHQNLRDDAQQYWPGMEIRKYVTSSLSSAAAVQTLANFLRTCPARAVVIGLSGSGKSTIAALLTSDSSHPTALIEARDCDKGVVGAIAKRLPQQAQDSGLLEALIYSGGLRVVIDALNESTETCRDEVRTFLAKFSGANVVILTQPIILDFGRFGLEQLELVAMGRNAAEDFLRFERDQYGLQDKLSEEKLGEILRLVEDERAAADRAFLSTPFDLQLILELAIAGRSFHTNRLMETMFEFWDVEHKNRIGTPLPIPMLSDLAYKLKTGAAQTIAASSLRKETVEFLVSRRILVRGFGTPESLVFRHARIQDFLIAVLFVAKSELTVKHAADVELIGVYEELAALMPASNASITVSKLALRAADASQHAVLDAFVRRIALYGGI